MATSAYAAAHPFGGPAASGNSFDPVTGLTYSGLAAAFPGTQDLSITQTGARLSDTLSSTGLLPITSSRSAESAEPESSPLITFAADSNDATPEAAPPQAPPTCEPGRSPIYCVYTVQRGDTLSRIATDFGLVSTDAVANWQLLVESNRPDITSADQPILAGQNIRIPTESGLIHLVLGGETLAGIADAFGVSTDAIVGVAANGLSDGQALVAGQDILVPSPSQIGVPPSAAAPQPTATPTPEATAEPDATDADAAATATEAPADSATPTPEVTDTVEPTATDETPEATPTPETEETPADAVTPTEEASPTPTVVAPADPGHPFIWPVAGPISSYFGPSHPLGIDIDLYAAPNAPIGASAAGIVTFAGGDPCCSYGVYVIVDHGNGYRTLYAHFSQINVSAGDVVAQGQVLGLAGVTGYSTGPHLHFEVHYDGAVIDPLTVLP